MREATPEERQSVRDYIESISEPMIKRLKAENNRLKKQIRLMKDKTRKRGLHTLWLFCVLDMRKEENEKLDRENKILRGRIKKLIQTCRELKNK